MRQQTPPTPGQPLKEALHIPLALGLLDDQGRDLPLRLAGEAGVVRSGTRLLEVREAEQVFRFVDLPEPPMPSLLRGFSAPVKVHFDYSDADLLFLMAHDSDGFNRWDAAQTLTQRLLLAWWRTPGQPLPAGFFEAWRRALMDARAEPALLAEMLTLPSESYLGDQMALVDVEAIHRAREALWPAWGGNCAGSSGRALTGTRIAGPTTQPRSHGTARPEESVSRLSGGGGGGRGPGALS